MSGQVARAVPVLDDDALYLGDNGECFCGRHAGASARFTGRDLSGQAVHKITTADQRYAAAECGGALACESCEVTS